MTQKIGDKLKQTLHHCIVGVPQRHGTHRMYMCGQESHYQELARVFMEKTRTQDLQGEWAGWKLKRAMVSFQLESEGLRTRQSSAGDPV